jgi:hypothetical protein
MRRWLCNSVPTIRRAVASTLTFVAFLTVIQIVGAQPAFAIPAFARKYGLPCSACHEAWPKLNNFGQTFKDNGYQLMNDRDAPIWQNPSYWPITFRITPNWHRESTNKVQVDAATASGSAEMQITSHGFDLSGLDFHTGGTLYKNISFYVLPSSDATGAFHFETVMARLDNIKGTPWLNVKVGKFELDNVISEKRILTISNNGGFYQLYHFSPVGDNNSFGQMGDNQLGVEVMGHSKDDRTRYSVALVSSNDGGVGLPTSNAYSTFITASQAFNTGRLGVQRVGGYAFIGEAPTYFQTQAGIPIPGSGLGNKMFHREGAFALLYAKQLDFSVFYQHGSDSAYFVNGAAANAPLPAGTQSPSWNGAFVETHYTVHPQLIFIQRSEWIRMSRQAFSTSAKDLGNIDAYTFGYRWYPIMSSRAGFAWHNEYSWVRQRGVSPVSNTDLSSGSLMAGFDFDF